LLLFTLVAPTTKTCLSQRLFTPVSYPDGAFATAKQAMLQRLFMPVAATSKT
jgi:hypothetical protein